jgi:hypothetical protein
MNTETLRTIDRMAGIGVLLLLGIAIVATQVHADLSRSPATESAWSTRFQPTYDFKFSLRSRATSIVPHAAISRPLEFDIVLELQKKRVGTDRPAAVPE